MFVERRFLDAPVLDALAGPQHDARPPHPALERLRGAGGCYNIGNLLGFVVSLSIQISHEGGSGAALLSGALYDHLIGSPSALALTVATLIFLFSGEIYHRAGQAERLRRIRLNRLADLLSACGAVALTLSLVYLGQSLPAVASGVGLVLGKLGSSAFGDDRIGLPAWPPQWPDPFRLTVLIGRMLGLAAVALALWRQASQAPEAEAAWQGLIQPATLAICHLIWLKADLLLLRGARSAVRTHHAP